MDSDGGLSENEFTESMAAKDGPTSGAGTADGCEVFFFGRG